MIITSWIERIGQSLKRSSQRKSDPRRGVAPAGERLEERSLLSAQAFFLNGVIDIALGPTDSVAVTENPVAPGTVQILINGTPAAAFPIVSASAVTKVSITGGDDANLIDLTGITSAVFNNAALSIVAHGGNGADTLLGSDSLADSLDGGHGADSIVGNGLNDTLLGNDGNDTITGGDGDDSIDAGDGQDSVDGGNGNDTLIAGDGQDSVTGSAGNDSISGGDGVDTLLGGDGIDLLNGEAGNDSLDGQNGDDLIFGGSGNDTLLGGSGADSVDGQGGNDLVFAEAVTGQVAAISNDTLLGGNGNDTLNGAAGNDVINGQAGDDLVVGNDGNDSILGGAGNDAVFGDSSDPSQIGNGNDTMFGNAGNDSLGGGGGADVMDGGSGNDLLQSFSFNTGNNVSLSVADAADAMEGGVGLAGTITFTVTLSQAQSVPVGVTFQVTDGSAVALQDYVSPSGLLSGTLTFNPGVTTQTVVLTTVDDIQAESTENLFLMLLVPTNAQISDGLGEGRILDNDGWLPLGPAPIINGGSVQGMAAQNNPAGGAVHVVVPHPTDANILYIGAVNGGIWRTNDALSLSPTWTPLTDQETSQSIGALEFDPSDSTNQTLVAGFGRFSSFQGAPPFLVGGGPLDGLIRTTDGGNTWTPITHPLLLNQTISAVAARGSVLLAGANNFYNSPGGMFRSVDGGANWVRVTVASGLANGAIYDIAGDPRVSTRFYAAVAGVGIFRSDDTGATWVDVTRGVTGLGANTDNTEIVVHNNGTTDAVYVGVVNNSVVTGLFRSANQGANWTALDIGNSSNGQGTVHFSLAADPNNPNLVYIGGNTGPLNRIDASQPLGSQVTSIVLGNAGGTRPHVDSRDMAFDAAGNLVEGDDGGVYRRSQPQSSAGVWMGALGNLQITEFHDLAYDSNSNVVFGGTQDNGTVVQVAPNSPTFDLMLGGDGSDVLVDNVTLAAQNQSIRYFSAQTLLAFRRQTFDANNNPVGGPTAIPLNVVGGGAPIVPSFYTPIELNEVAPTRLLIGASNSLYESLDQGATFTEIAPGLATNGFAFGGGIVQLGDALVAGGTSGGVANPNLLYVGSGNRVFVRTAGNGAPTQSVSYPGGAVRDIVVDPNNFMTAFVLDTFSVFRTTDAGATWANVTTNMIDATRNLRGGELVSLEYIPGAAGTSDFVLAGGQQGVFQMRVNAPGMWDEFDADLPNIQVWELDYDPVDNVLVAGTIGRGAWSFPNANLGFAASTPVIGNPIIQAPEVGDTLLGGTGDDLIVGASGDDIINADGGNDTVFAGIGNDSILGGSGADFLDGQEGNDTLAGQGGKDTLVGGEGDDTFQWNAVTDGDDVVSSVNGFDQMQITATSAADTVSIGKVGPRIQVTSGSNVLTINAAIHVISIDLGNGDDVVTVGDLLGVSQTVLTISGGDGNDTLDASAGVLGDVRLRLNGDAGNDRINGSANDDTIDGGTGRDTLLGGNGNDSIFGGTDNDAINGGAGNDSITGDDGNDTLAGGDGNDTLLGGNGNDSLTAQAGDDSLDGAAGRDTLLGGDGNDSLDAGEGKDFLTGGEGNDTLDGGRNDDTIFGDAGADTIRGNHGIDSIDAGTGDDTVSGGDGNDIIAGGDGNDLMTGGDGNDILNGAAGNDTLTGSDGNDILAGGSGNDIVLGDDGDDTIKGNGGSNTLAGGQCNDSIVGAVGEINENFVLSDDLLKKLDLL